MTTPDTDPIVTKGTPIVLAAIEHPDLGGRKALMWCATVRFARVRGAQHVRELRCGAQVVREGAIVRMLMGMGLGTLLDLALVCSWPERAWVAVVGTEIRVMAGTVGATLRAHLVSFGPLERDKAAERAERRAENQRAWQARNAQLREERDRRDYGQGEASGVRSTGGGS